MVKLDKLYINGSSRMSTIQKCKKVKIISWRLREISQKSLSFFFQHVDKLFFITFSILGVAPWNFFYKLSRRMGRLSWKHFVEFLFVEGRDMTKVEKQGIFKYPVFDFGQIPTSPHTKIKKNTSKKVFPYIFGACKKI